MKFIPHVYQAYAISHIESHKEAALFLDMGLGKTVITLTAINELAFFHRAFLLSSTLPTATE